MTWKPLIETVTEDEGVIMSAAAFRVRSLAMLGSIVCELRLLNARYEETEETGIEETDV